MNTILLQSAITMDSTETFSAQLMKLTETLIPYLRDTETNCQDVKIAEVICCTFICVAGIIIIGFLIWKLMDYCFICCSESKKRKWAKEDQEKRQKAELLNKYITDSEKRKTEQDYTNVLAYLVELSQQDKMNLITRESLEKVLTKDNNEG